MYQLLSNYLPWYLHFAVVVLLVAALVWCLRYLFITWKVIRHHKRELERMAQVADPETMAKYTWKAD